MTTDSNDQYAPDMIRGDLYHKVIIHNIRDGYRDVYFSAEDDKKDAATGCVKSMVICDTREPIWDRAPYWNKETDEFDWDLIHSTIVLTECELGVADFIVEIDDDFWWFKCSIEVENETPIS